MLQSYSIFTFFILYFCLIDKFSSKHLVAHFFRFSSIASSDHFHLFTFDVYIHMYQMFER